MPQPNKDGPRKSLFDKKTIAAFLLILLAYNVRGNLRREYSRIGMDVKRPASTLANAPSIL